jgi:outer membrane biosynthesis protein TonB
MGRLRPPLIALALAALAALGLAACGSSGADLLPGKTASEINSNLDQVEQRASEGDCVGAEDAAQAVSVQIEELGGVDEKLKQALREGASRLNEVVASCEETPSEETLPAIEPAEELEEEKEKKKKPEKPAKAKPEKEEKEPVEEEAAANPSLPPQANGEAKGHEKEEVPPVESGAGTPSGGVGPGTPAGSE